MKRCRFDIFKGIKNKQEEEEKRSNVLFLLKRRRFVLCQFG
jgi:hypothetical protein